MNFVSRKLLSVFLLLLAGEGSASRVVAQNLELVSAPEPQIISTAPDGKFIVRREKTDPGEHGEARKSLEICSSSGKILYAWISGLVFITFIRLENLYGHHGEFTPPEAGCRFG